MRFHLTSFQKISHNPPFFLPDSDFFSHFFYLKCIPQDQWVYIYLSVPSERLWAKALGEKHVAFTFLTSEEQFWSNRTAGDKRKRCKAFYQHLQKEVHTVFADESMAAFLICPPKTWRLCACRGELFRSSNREMKDAKAGRKDKKNGKKSRWDRMLQIQERESNEWHCSKEETAISQWVHIGENTFHSEQYRCRTRLWLHSPSWSGLCFLTSRTCVIL